MQSRYLNNLVSIVLPLFNREDLVERAILSALQQKGPDVEVIVVDDASTDGSRDIVANLAEREKRIRLFELSSNGGAPAARTIGISRAEGNWVMFLDSDDYLLPDCLSKRLTVACERGVEVVHSECWVQAPNSESKYLFSLPPLEGWVHHELLSGPR